MAFDAGAIVASAKIDQSQLDRDIADVERKLGKLEKEHSIRLSAVFDNESLGKARKMFADLDNNLSRDAMQRLRTSPQGSVLGALNALFSPHQVAGGPTAQQAASQGLLGKMVGGQGSGGAVGTSPGGRSNNTMTTADVIKTMVTGQQPGNVTTTDTIKRDITGAAPGDVTTTDTIKEKLDPASAEQVRKDSATSGDKSGQSFADAFRKHLSSLFKGFGGGGGGGAGGGGLGSFGANLASGIGPGILGVSAKAGLGVAGIGSLLGSLPALLTPLLALGIGGLGAGVVGLGAKQLIGTANQAGQAPTQGVLYNPAQDVKTAATQTMAAVESTLIGPLSAAFKSIPGMLSGLVPVLKSVFSGAGALVSPLLDSMNDIAHMVLPALGAAFKAVAPLLEPLLDGLGQLLKGLLTPLAGLFKAAMPAVTAFAQVLGQLGKDIGSMFSDFGPVLSQSAIIFKSLMDLISGLFPVIGKLAAIFASALAPVFVQFAGAIKALLPFLTTMGGILGQLAAAVLGDLGGAFGALAALLTDIAPSLNGLATALGGVFNTLENTGVFAVLGNALENLAKPLAGLINALLNGLKPILPVITQLINQLLADGVNIFTTALAGLLPPLTKLATSVMGALAAVLPVIVPLLGKLAAIFTDAVVTAISGIATALAAIINAIPASVLGGIVTAILAIVAGVKLWAAAQVILNSALLTNPLVLLLAAVVALGVGIDELVTHWSAVWGTIKSVAEDAWNFIFNGWGKYLLVFLGPEGLLVLGIIEVWKNWSTIWGTIKSIVEDAWNFIFNGVGKYLLPLLGPAGLIALGVIELSQHWTTIWGDIKQTASDFYTWIWSDFGAKISTFMTSTLPGYFKTAVSVLGGIWNGLKTVMEAPVKFVIDDIIDGLISAFDWVSSKIGGPTISPVHPFGLAGGGKITAGTGPTADDVLIAVSKGETVLTDQQSRMLAPLLKMIGVKGYASGGTPIPPVSGPPIGISGSAGSGPPGIIGTLVDWGKILAALATGNTTALANAISAMVGGGTGGAIGDMAALIAAVPKTLIKDAVSTLLSAFSASPQGSGSTAPGKAGPGGGTPAANAALAQKLYPLWGFGPFWTAWNAVAMRESGWNQYATNPGSGAYGIPQALPGSKMGPAANPPQSNPTAQINWMVGYIKAVYGDPVSAWNHEMSAGWYDNGGWLAPGPMNGTGRMEAVLTPGQSDAFQAFASGLGSGDLAGRLDRIASLVSTLIGTTAAVPAGVGRHVGGAFGNAAAAASFRQRYPAGGA